MTTPMILRALPLPIILGALLIPSIAQGQEDPRKGQAEAVFTEGVKLHDAGKNAEALAKYEKAYEIFPTPNILFASARIEQLLGRSLKSLRHYREALKSPLLHPANRELGKKYVPELEGALARVDVKGPAGAVFQIDGKRYMTPIDEPIDVEPGQLAIDASVGGAKYAGKATAQRGGRVELELRPVEASPIASPTTPDATERPSFWSAGNTVGVVFAGVSLAAIGGFVAARVAASSKADDADAAATDPSAQKGCDGVSSPACDRVRSSAQSERDLTTASTVFLVGGIASAAVAAGAFLFWPKSGTSSRAVTLAPSMGRTSTGVLLQGRF